MALLAIVIFSPELKEVIFSFHFWVRDQIPPDDWRLAQQGGKLYSNLTPGHP